MPSVERGAALQISTGVQQRGRSETRLRKKINESSGKIQKSMAKLSEQFVKHQSGKSVAGGMTQVAGKMATFVRRTKTNLFEYERQLALLSKSNQSMKLKSKIIKLRYDVDVMEQKIQQIQAQVISQVSGRASGVREELTEALPNEIENKKIDSKVEKRYIFKIRRIGFFKPKENVRDIAREINNTAKNCLKIEKYLDEKSLDLASGRGREEGHKDRLRDVNRAIDYQESQINQLKQRLNAEQPNSRGVKKLKDLIALHEDLLATLKSKHAHLDLYSTKIFSEGINTQFRVDEKLLEAKKAKTGTDEATKLLEAHELLESYIQSQKYQKHLDSDASNEFKQAIQQIVDTTKYSLTGADYKHEITLRRSAKGLLKKLNAANSTSSLDKLKNNKRLLLAGLREIITKDLIQAVYHMENGSEEQERKLANVESLLEKATVLECRDQLLEDEGIKRLMARCEALPLYQSKTANKPDFRKGIELSNQFVRSMGDISKDEDMAGFTIIRAFHQLHELNQITRRVPDSVTIRDNLAAYNPRLRGYANHKILKWETSKRNKLFNEITTNKQVSDPNEAPRRLAIILTKMQAAHLLSLPEGAAPSLNVRVGQYNNIIVGNSIFAEEYETKMGSILG